MVASSSVAENPPPPFRCHNFGRGSRFPNISFNSFHAAPTVPRLLQQKNNAPRLLFQLESTKSRLAAYLQFVTFLTGTSRTLFPKCGNNQMLKMQRNVNCFATKYSNEHTRGGGGGGGVVVESLFGQSRRLKVLSNSLTNIC